MTRFTKILFTSLILFVFTIGYSTTTNAESVKQKEVRLIAELKEKIENLGETPIKKHIFKHNLRKKYIAALEEQLEKLEKEKGIKEKKQALMDDLCKQIKELDSDAKTVCDDSTDALDKDKDIIAAKKQIDDLKKAKKIEEENADKKKKAEKKKAEEEEKNRIAEEEEKEKREAAIIRVKKEIYFLGGTPITEFESESEDAFVEALKKQLEELKIQKEKETAQSIPEWYLNPPRSTDSLIYVVGDSVSDQIHLAKTIARNRALNALGQTVSTELSSKSKETIRQAGIGEDQVSKTEINLISSVVSDEVKVSGFEVIKTEIIPQDNGSYKGFILIEFPVAKAYKTYMEKIEESPELKGRLTEIKNTDIYKELQKAVAAFSGT